MHMFYQRTIQLVQVVCRTTPYVNESPDKGLAKYMYIVNSFAILIKPTAIDGRGIEQLGRSVEP